MAWRHGGDKAAGIGLRLLKTRERQRSGDRETEIRRFEGGDRRGWSPPTHGRSDPGSLGREPLCSTSGAGRGRGRERRVIGSHPGHWGTRGPARGARETPFKTPAPAEARVDGSGDGGAGLGDQVRAGLTTEAERGNSPRSRTESRIRNSEAERGKRESRGQKRAEAQTEASARGDAGTRRERFGSVTVLPHLEDITSPLKKNKYKKGLDIKRRQILLSLEGGGEEVVGGNVEQMRPRGVAEPGARTGEGARPAAQVPAGVAQGSPPHLPSFRIHAAQRTARCPGHCPGSCIGPGCASLVHTPPAASEPFLSGLRFCENSPVGGGSALSQLLSS
ncbi:uncharacterized protein LOC129656493 [Bubalus kerabau]|uniref:uncharacterized protein LOC129656493 n=1 Tax=Bubalus carabanensis TaxID=3119969 RepID=UPI00244E9D25|nr:uncharacterized protein LOC129656493 [Bubalus carabanensis]